jgi:SpoVK/Ycf46/Vps4 family AAA+-type ATPase
VIGALQKKKAATMCFYGLPGTGKTQLAEYIADKLDMPLLVKRASDILSKWVGENEQHIAEMFREAKAEGAVLLLDEADSFLRDRALAKSQWEVTMVNELLQGMERHTGIFICASNLFESLDAAALRRFTFKFQFLELDEQQRVKMFTNEAGVEPQAGSDLFDRLMMIRHLTPGDFATVKRQINLFDQQLTPEEWLVQLSEEAKAKLAGLQRNKMIDVDRV